LQQLAVEPARRVPGDRVLVDGDTTITAATVVARRDGIIDA
jgi:hypothetical protein